MTAAAGPAAGVARERLAAALVIGLAALVHGTLAVTDQGVFWPDEIFQSLEQAHRLAFGYGILPWEFHEGARSWLFPGVFAALWRALDFVGVSDAQTLVITAKLLMAAVTVLGIAMAMRLAAHFAGPAAGIFAGLLLLAWPPLVLIGARALTEVASAAVVAGAALLIQKPEPRRLALAGALAATACFLRYQNGIVAMGLAACVLAQGRWPALRAYLLGACVAAWCGGLLDLATWGAPFHSFNAYLHYNVIQQESATYGVAPPRFYWVVAWSAVGPAFAAVLLGWALAPRAAYGLLAVGLLFVLAHAPVGHKEIRFLAPVVPLLLAVAAAGLAQGLRRLTGSRVALPALGVLLAAAMGRHAQTLTFEQLGQYVGQPGAPHSPWRFNDGLNRLLWEVGRLPDACGVWMSGVRPAWSGGFSYLHRDIPLLWGFEPGLLRNANYVVLPPKDLPMPVAPWEAEVVLPPPYHPVMRAGGWTLHRREGGCEPPVGDYRRLFG